MVRNFKGPHRLARSRTPASQAENTGSNPVGAAIWMVSAKKIGGDPKDFPPEADQPTVGTLLGWF